MIPHSENLYFRGRPRRIPQNPDLQYCLTLLTSLAHEQDEWQSAELNKPQASSGVSDTIYGRPAAV